MRLDKFLKLSRVIKRRTVAASAADAADPYFCTTIPQPSRLGGHHFLQDGKNELFCMAAVPYKRAHLQFGIFTSPVR